MLKVTGAVNIQYLGYLVLFTVVNSMAKKHSEPLSSRPKIFDGRISKTIYILRVAQSIKNHV